MSVPNVTPKPADDGCCSCFGARKKKSPSKLDKTMTTVKEIATLQLPAGTNRENDVSAPRKPIPRVNAELLTPLPFVATKDSTDYTDMPTLPLQASPPLSDVHKHLAEGSGKKS